MKNPFANNTLSKFSASCSPQNATSLLTLTALLLCGLAVPTTAQTASITRIAAEKSFTIAPNVQTPIVLKSKPDAACDLHAVGVTDKDQTLRYYANGDGYLKIHATAKEASEEGSEMQLDCVENGAITRYPLHLRASYAPTEDMPAPQSVMLTPKGSKLRPGLSKFQALQLSNDELVDGGYGMRPDAAASPEKFAQWLDQVSKPMTEVPSHLVSRSDITHQVQGVEAGITDNYNWSGFVADHAKRTYSAVSACWNVPEIDFAEKNHSTYSAFWIGLDGYNLSDLVQAGTEQDAIDDGGTYYAEYSAWEELLPNQPTEQDVSLSPNAGDRMCVEVWISTGSGAPNADGAYAAFRLQDVTQSQSTGSFYVALGGTYYNGSEAEWIMERPGLAGNKLAELSDYNNAQMIGASALTTKGSWKNYSAIENIQLWLYNEKINGNDNNLLSEAFGDIYQDPTTDIYFQWLNFH